MDGFAGMCGNGTDLEQLRGAIRQFLEADEARYGWRPAVDAWLSGWDADFSRRLGAAGFLGLTVPTTYGGRGLGYLHRYVVTEELLVSGAPVAAHWMADRQIAPALLAYGTEELRRRLLPGITAGRLYFAIGLSEHAAGSDLAAVRTKATRLADGWRLNGTKVWTSGAHLANYIVVLARTNPSGSEGRHGGLSQFIVTADAPGLTIDPIVTMSGEHHFNEVVLDDVLVADADVLGEVDAGWRQVTSELSFERSGPERILTTAPLILAAVKTLAVEGYDHHTAREVGELLARVVSLRQLSISVARTLSAGRPAAVQAAVVKDLGTQFEQKSVDLVARLLDGISLDVAMTELLNTGWLHRPMFTLRGGTNEVLRGLVARGMGLR